MCVVVPTPTGIAVDDKDSVFLPQKSSLPDAMYPNRAKPGPYAGLPHLLVRGLCDAPNFGQYIGDVATLVESITIARDGQPVIARDGQPELLAYVQTGLQELAPKMYEVEARAGNN